MPGVWGEARPGRVCVCGGGVAGLHDEAPRAEDREPLTRSRAQRGCPISQAPRASGAKPLLPPEAWPGARPELEGEDSAWRGWGVLPPHSPQEGSTCQPRAVTAGHRTAPVEGQQAQQPGRGRGRPQGRPAGHRGGRCAVARVPSRRQGHGEDEVAPERREQSWEAGACGRLGRGPPRLGQGGLGHQCGGTAFSTGVLGWRLPFRVGQLALV